VARWTVVSNCCFLFPSYSSTRLCSLGLNTWPRADLSAAEVERVIDDLAAVAHPVRLAFRWRPRLSDPNDDMVLETAVNGNAHAIVTFNQRDFEAAVRDFGCAVILPGAALGHVRSSNP